MTKKKKQQRQEIPKEALAKVIFDYAVGWAWRWISKKLSRKKRK